MIALTRDQFLNDVKDHVMTVLRDDGLYRHIRFKKPASSCMYFDLLTYPGGLLYRGDMGSFAFERLADMFEFFRADGGQINPGYWSGKLVAVNRDGRSSVTEFDAEQFDREIKREVLAWCRENGYRTSRDQRRDLWDAVMSEVIDAGESYDGDTKKRFADEFTHQFGGGIYFVFDNPWEMSCDRYTHGFLWCCHALAWGIAKYDEMKAQEKACAPAAVEGGAA
jgi:hypothetical protein